MQVNNRVTFENDIVLKKSEIINKISDTLA